MSKEQPSSKVSRRDFMKAAMSFVGGVIGLGVGLPIVGYFIGPALKKESSEAWIPAGPLKNYPLDKPTLFTFTRTQQHGWEKTSQSYGVYVLDEPKKVEAFSNICTHLGCRVKWDDDAGEYICPCHDSHFAKDGTVLSGPAPRPLDQYETKVENGTLYLHFIKKE